MGAVPSSHIEQHLDGTKLSSNEDVKLPFEEQTNRKNPLVHDPAEEYHEKLPHNYHSIIKEEDEECYSDDIPILHSSDMYSGIYLKKNTKKYWIDKESGCNCFFLFARELSITWGEDKRYWQWCSMKETSEIDIEVAKLQNVCWLEIQGSVGDKNLNPGAKYEVAFVVRMDDPAYGWEVPVLLRLRSSSSTDSVQRREVRLMDEPKGRWIELLVGSFTADRGGDGGGGGVMEFSMSEWEGGLWKSGLVLKGAVIRAKD